MVVRVTVRACLLSLLPTLSSLRIAPAVRWQRPGAQARGRCAVEALFIAEICPQDIRRRTAIVNLKLRIVCLASGRGKSGADAHAMLVV